MFNTRLTIITLLLLMPLAGFCEETIEEVKEKEISSIKRISSPYHGPLLLTSLGKGPSGTMARVQLEIEARLPVHYDPVAGTDELMHYQTLAVAAGISTKGLEMAGTDLVSEASRTVVLLGMARDKKIPVLLLHLGGATKRTEPDQKILEKAIPLSDHIIVMKDGNQDQYFTDKANEYRIELTEVETFDDLPGVLRNLFGAGEQ